MQLLFNLLTMTTSEVIKVTLVSQQPKGKASRCLKTVSATKSPIHSANLPVPFVYCLV